jgi:hypothetical protein
MQEIKAAAAAKMADVVSEEIQAALNKIATTTDQRTNKRKDLKKTSNYHCVC